MLVLAMQFSRDQGGQLEAGRLVVNARMPPDRGRGGGAPRVRGLLLKTEDSRPNREPSSGGNTLRLTTLSEADWASLQLGSRPHVVWVH